MTDNIRQPAEFDDPLTSTYGPDCYRLFARRSALLAEDLELKADKEGVNGNRHSDENFCLPTSEHVAGDSSH